MVTPNPLSAADQRILLEIYGRKTATEDNRDGDAVARLLQDGWLTNGSTKEGRWILALTSKAAAAIGVEETGVSQFPIGFEAFRYLRRVVHILDDVPVRERLVAKNAVAFTEDYPVFRTRTGEATYVNAFTYDADGERVNLSLLLADFEKTWTVEEPEGRESVEVPLGFLKRILFLADSADKTALKSRRKKALIDLQAETQSLLSAYTPQDREIFSGWKSTEK